MTSLKSLSVKSDIWSPSHGLHAFFPLYGPQFLLIFFCLKTFLVIHCNNSSTGSAPLPYQLVTVVCCLFGG